MDYEILRVEMLGGFSIFFGDKYLDVKTRKTAKHWKLVQYLIAYRHKSISQNELIEVFCEDKLIHDPNTALRMMAYRARSLLENAGLPFANELIVANDGAYTWNNKIHCIVDAEEFESLCKKADLAKADEERLEMLLIATTIYRGDFLPSSSGELWVIPLARRYHSMYTKCVHEALQILIMKGRNAESKDLSARALRIDPFNEDILACHLSALHAQGKRVEALEAYKRMETMFFDILGVQFSDDLRALYDQIQRPEIKKGIQLDSILSEWLDDADFPGAYYCDISVFKTMYQIESRSIPRSGRSAYVIGINTKHEPSKKIGVMKKLGTIIPGNLRKGDMFTRASPNQYLLMLSNLNNKDCETLVNRILSSIDAKYLKGIIGVTIKPVVPIMEVGQTSTF